MNEPYERLFDRIIRSRCLFLIWMKMEIRARIESSPCTSEITRWIVPVRQVDDPVHHTQVLLSLRRMSVWRKTGLEKAGKGCGSADHRVLLSPSWYCDNGAENRNMRSKISLESFLLSWMCTRV